MSGVIPREQAFAAARVRVDRARVRIAADRAAGRLTPDHAALIDRLWGPVPIQTPHHAAA
ncbi:hypothetical protein [Streptomyces sp. NBC_01217]|uniref:hypothetical protein n=1 Tax=Streptomyces sp. NBC_01217 TaxID=2903779 RepID=UPI002E13B442|nr:hypothetical protein OG507_21145 [Streptomyces sp. NBC_01217]